MLKLGYNFYFFIVITDASIIIKKVGKTRF
jgi:hypothetical protein